MNGAMPVEAVHEWSGYVTRYLQERGGDGNNERADKAALRAEVELMVKRPVVWADSGRANWPFRYYLTDADLPLVNSQLNSNPEEYPHEVKVKVLEDDPRSRCQTLQVTVSGDITDFTNVYEVKDDRVRPIKWSRWRPMAAGFPVLFLAPAIFIVSALFWGWLLRKRFFRRTTGIS